MENIEIILLRQTKQGLIITYFRFKIARLPPCWIPCRNKVVIKACFIQKNLLNGTFKIHSFHLKEPLLTHNSKMTALGKFKSENRQ